MIDAIAKHLSAVSSNATAPVPAGCALPGC